MEKVQAIKLPDLRTESLITREIKNLWKMPEDIEDHRQAMALIKQIKMPNGQASSLLRSLNRFQ